MSPARKHLPNKELEHSVCIIVSSSSVGSRLLKKKISPKLKIVKMVFA
jgi:hypothetical protein